MKRRVITILLLSAILLQCFGCAKNENSPVKVYLRDQPETAVGLSNKAVDYMVTLWNEAHWKKGSIKLTGDYIFLYNNRIIHFISEQCLLNDFENNRHCYISEDQRDHINSLLNTAFS